MASDLKGNQPSFALPLHALKVSYQHGPCPFLNGFYAMVRAGYVDALVCFVSTRQCARS
jgi:hypothetical protein